MMDKPRREAAIQAWKEGLCIICNDPPKKDGEICVACGRCVSCGHHPCCSGYREH